MWLGTLRRWAQLRAPPGQGSVGTTVCEDTDRTLSTRQGEASGETAPLKDSRHIASGPTLVTSHTVETPATATLWVWGLGRQQ